MRPLPARPPWKWLGNADNLGPARLGAQKDAKPATKPNVQGSQACSPGFSGFLEALQGPGVRERPGKRPKGVLGGVRGPGVLIFLGLPGKGRGPRRPPEAPTGRRGPPEAPGGTPEAPGGPPRPAGTLKGFRGGKRGHQRPPKAPRRPPDGFGAPKATTGKAHNLSGRS